MDKDGKFDKFIEDFDKSLDTDTSSFKTIGLHKTITGASTGRMSSSPSSPVMTTPTKSRRNSIPPEEAPLHPIRTLDSILDGVDGNTGIKPGINVNTPPSTAATTTTTAPGGSNPRPVKLSSGFSGVGGMKRSSTVSSGLLARQPSRRGLNLNLMNTHTRQHSSGSRVTSPEPQGSTSSNSTPQRDNNFTPSRRISTTPNGKHGISASRPRRRTNSSVTSTDFDELSDTFRMLATKEMRIVELKEQMKRIQRELELEEAELKKLKTEIGNTIQKDMSSPSVSQKTIREDPAEAQAASVKQDHSLPSQVKPLQSSVSKRTSIWSKPVNFLNQFDQLLQNEIEKLNKDSFGSSTTSTKDEDMLNTVSSSLWTFVSDVKQGLMGDYDTEEDINSNSTKHEQSNGTAHEQEMITINRHK